MIVRAGKVRTIFRDWIRPRTGIRMAAVLVQGGDTIESMPGKAAYSYADLATFPDDGLRREIIDGELIVSPAPRLRHQRISARLYLIIGNHLEAHGGGELFYAPVDVLFSDTNVVEPDLLFVADDQSGILTEMNVQGAPALVIEVLSEARIDRVRKRDLYARFGVPEYWVVDPEADRVEVYRLRGGAYAKPEIFEPGDVLAYQRLSGLEIDLTRLFAR
jgi:Uma2 family endonuclease